jgi:hypothetical protein
MSRSVRAYEVSRAVWAFSVFEIVVRSAEISSAEGGMPEWLADFEIMVGMLGERGGETRCGISRERDGTSSPEKGRYELRQSRWPSSGESAVRSAGRKSIQILPPSMSTQEKERKI